MSSVNLCIARLGSYQGRGLWLSLEHRERACRIRVDCCMMVRSLQFILSPWVLNQGLVFLYACFLYQILAYYCTSIRLSREIVLQITTILLTSYSPVSKGLLLQINPPGGPALIPHAGAVFPIPAQLMLPALLFALSTTTIALQITSSLPASANASTT